VTRARRGLALLSALLVTVAALLPTPQADPTAVVTVVPLLALLAAGSVLIDLGRAFVACAVAGWIAVLVVLGTPDDLLVVASAVLLRLWAGVPELVRLGRPGLPDLAADVVGGTAVAVLVLLVARDPDQIPTGGLLLALVAGAALGVVGALRLRR
jgi:hypothetical protein